ncbi:hypothetical protein [Lishizhenia sp.]|uniref:hypothetical protein n=1 Tax=Lishizhenia sp. TaxID=2497594 RepID=UPI00299D356E|nr:hypothetical protein [Lishizhenia sp.]MDX1446620.1 hypothetical protein [Lishizhenia sp.]
MTQKLKRKFKKQVNPPVKTTMGSGNPDHYDKEGLYKAIEKEAARQAKTKPKK